MLEVNTTIKTWKEFARLIRPKGCNLLCHLDRFPDSILITGCQRSGTTMLTRTITQSDGMVNYWFGEDDELDAALILSGNVAHACRGRYCFQTTYLNECYPEYFAHKNYKMIWVLRNPHSVVYSLLYNWRRWTLNELFVACGLDLLEESYLKRYQRYGLIGVPKIIRACLAYNGKISQLLELKKRLDQKMIFAVEYDQLVNDTQHQLPRIYEFVNLAYQEGYCKTIHKKSTGKKKLLSRKENEIVGRICLPIYETALKCLD